MAYSRSSFVVSLCLVFFLLRCNILAFGDVVDYFTRSINEGFEGFVAEEEGGGTLNDALYGDKKTEGDNGDMSGGEAFAKISKPCKTNINGIFPPPYNNITNMVCKPIWNSYILRHHKGEENLVTFILSAVYTTGWVGIGFTKDGRMVGSRAVVAWFSDQGLPRIKQYYVKGTSPSQVIVDSGELDLTNVPPVVALSRATIYMTFQAKFQHPLRKHPFLFARMRRIKGMKRNHGTLAVLAWGGLLPVGGIIARYMRPKDPLWYYLHTGFQVTGCVASLAAVIVGQQMYAKINSDVSFHKSIGIFVLVLKHVLVLAFFLRPNKDAKIRKYWNMYHGWFGRIALFVGACNATWGIHMASAGLVWKAIFALQMTDFGHSSCSRNIVAEQKIREQ
ncbi:hypothetical protein K2173_025440 [Erythroxylum novogranatense]|uniref:Cytochrome b561 and DOMON domain-containing protein n=1 Tax=Erythroxylum novogranatense TaxID=1862640 RepID=A0AAV8UDX9_9ROSI|nr:hypothetical protein K2173_025440 [Erythroxylum novogranatense]